MQVFRTTTKYSGLKLCFTGRIGECCSLFSIWPRTRNEHPSASRLINGWDILLRCIKHVHDNERISIKKISQQFGIVRVMLSEITMTDEPQHLFPVYNLRFLAIVQWLLFWTNNFLSPTYNILDNNASILACILSAQQEIYISYLRFKFHSMMTWY